MVKENVKVGRIVLRYWGTLNFDQFMMRTLSGTKPHRGRSFLFHFNNPRSIHDIIYGEIFKTKLGHKYKELVSPENVEYIDREINELFKFIRFCIFPDHTIIFTNRSEFGPDEFLKVFIKLVRLNAPDIFNLDVIYQREDNKIFEIIKSLDRLAFVKILRLRKSNPDPKPTFEKIERFLENERTTEYSATFTSDKEEGLNREVDSHIMSAISLADAGYGEAEIQGIRKKESVRILSTDNIIQSDIDKIPYEDWETFLEIVKTKIWEKMKHE